MMTSCEWQRPTPAHRPGDQRVPGLFPARRLPGAQRDGADDSGAIQITDVVRVGQTVQFHVRDAETADEDLRSLLAARKPAGRPVGALLFTCNGRGTRLFDKPDHDVGVIHEVYGPIPVAGFFAMGEIGPIGGQNFVHGYTASIVLFEQPA